MASFDQRVQPEDVQRYNFVIILKNCTLFDTLHSYYYIRNITVTHAETTTL
jgi:hypothetical protein